MAKKNSEATIDEFLITLEYLLKNCYNEKTAAKKQDIIRYALNEHGIEIKDGRRIALMLDILESACDYYPDVLQFKLCKIELKSHNKYYIEHRAYSDEEIEDILIALKTDSYLSKETRAKLMQKILDLGVNKKKHDIITKKVAKGVKDLDVNIINRDIVKTLEDAQANKKMIIYKTVRAKGAFAYDRWQGIGRRNEEGFGYVYKLFMYNNILYACIYNPAQDQKNAFIIDTTNIRLQQRPIDMEKDAEKVTFELCENKRLKETLTIDEFIDRFRKKNLGTAKEFVCKYRFRYEGNFEAFKMAFKQYWGEEIKCEIIETKSHGVVPPIEHEAIFTICRPYDEFEDWYLQRDILHKVTIISPEGLQESILSDYIKTCIFALNCISKEYAFSLDRKHMLKDS